MPTYIPNPEPLKLRKGLESVSPSRLESELYDIPLSSIEHEGLNVVVEPCSAGPDGRAEAKEERIGNGVDQPWGF